MSKKQPTANVEYVDYSISTPSINVDMRGIQFVRNDFTDLPFFLGNRSFTGTQIDPRRDVDQECGYLLTEELTPDAYKSMYDRESIATRVVQLLPRACWQEQPSLFEDDDTEISTPFEVAWSTLSQHLRGTSWHKDDDSGNPVWEYLQRADMLSGIGHFGLILLGVDDGEQLSDPIEGFETGFPLQDNSPNQQVGVARFGSIGAGIGLGTDLQYGKMTTFGGDTASYIHNKSELLSYNEARTQLNKLRREGYRVTMHLVGGCINNGEKETELTVNNFQTNKDQWYLNYSKIPTANFVNDDDEDSGFNSTPINIPESETSQTPQDMELDPATEDIPGDVAEDNPNAGEQEDTPEPVQQVETKRKLLYMRVFDESLIQITRYEADTTNSRFGQPVMYLVTINDPKEMHSGIGLTTATISVHWSRVIHVADNLNSSEVFGVPRMRPVWNRLCDLKKLYGGSAEMYWKAAFMGLALETHPQLGGDVQLDITELRQQLERYQNSLQRYLAIEGTHVNPLAPQVVSPADHIDKEIEAICVQLDVPKRKFMGSERGELASSQDDGDWNGTLMERQTNYLTPKIIIPFVDRLIMIGILPPPTQYKLKWPDLNSLEADEQAQIGLQQTQAIAAYMQGGCDALISPQDYLVYVLGFDEEEAEAILDNTHQHLAEANPDTDPSEIVPGTQPKPDAPIDPQTGQPTPMLQDGTAQFAPQPDQHLHTGDTHQHLGDSNFNAPPAFGQTSDKAKSGGNGKTPFNKPSKVQAQ